MARALLLMKLETPLLERLTLPALVADAQVTAAEATPSSQK